MGFVLDIVKLASVLAKSGGFVVALGFQHEASLQQHLQIVVSVESRYNWVYRYAYLAHEGVDRLEPALQLLVLLGIIVQGLYRVTDGAETLPVCESLEQRT